MIWFNRLLDKLGLLDWWQSRNELRRLQRERHRISVDYHKANDGAKAAGKSAEELRKLFSAMRADADAIEEEITEAVSWHLIARAERYGVPPPDLDPNDEAVWVRGHISTSQHLTPQAYADLRSAIRKEQKERREMWLPLAQWFVTVLSLLIALVAVLKK